MSYIASKSNDIYALVDCNNFYASCERVFNPKLSNKPVVILSNNDGCIVSRSNEAKSLGIKMAAPYFKTKSLISANHVHVFSSNYSLYGDMSRRVHETLCTFTPNIEIYSVDEAFLKLSGFENHDLIKYGEKIRETVFKNTGIPVSIGIARSKVLAKVANRLAKKYKKFNNVFSIVDHEKLDKILESVKVEDLWGVGKAYTNFLKYNKIATALDLSRANLKWIKKHLGINVVRIINELNEHDCIELEEVVNKKKGITTSRSFGKEVREYEEMKEAISTYASQAAKKMRADNLLTNTILIFVMTHPFKDGFYSNSIKVNLPFFTDITPEIIKYSIFGLKKIFRPNLSYKKAGVMFFNLTESSNVQRTFFELAMKNRDKNEKLMKILDKINSDCHDKIKYACCGIEKNWKMRRNKCSPHYTTSWDDLVTVYAK